MVSDSVSYKDPRPAPWQWGSTQSAPSMQLGSRAFVRIAHSPQGCRMKRHNRTVPQPQTQPLLVKNHFLVPELPFELDELGCGISNPKIPSQRASTEWTASENHREIQK